VAIQRGLEQERTAIPLFAHGSFTQFGGGLDVLGALPGVIWILALSIVMIRQSPR
jgi:hypothetical protein